MSQAELEAFGQVLGDKGLSFNPTPRLLRAGGTSRWYFDARAALAHGDELVAAARFISEKAQEVGADYDVVAGMGVAGRALASGVRIVWVNDDESDQDRLNGYGLHGASVEGRQVLVVDTGSTGDSLETTISMVRAEGGEVEYAGVLCDRSKGKVKRRLGRLGVEFFTVFVLNERKGMLVPSSHSGGRFRRAT